MLLRSWKLDKIKNMRYISFRKICKGHDTNDYIQGDNSDTYQEKITEKQLRRFGHV